MKTLARFLFVALVAASASFADDSVFVTLSNQLADQASAAHDAALPAQGTCHPHKILNWELRGTMKDIRKIALEFRDRAAKCKARTLVGRMKVKRMVANMQTANFLIANGAAETCAAYLPAWETARTTLGSIVAEMCCGGNPGGGSSDEPPSQGVAE